MPNSKYKDFENSASILNLAAFAVYKRYMKHPRANATQYKRTSVSRPILDVAPKAHACPTRNCRGGACSNLKFPFPGARPTYTRQRQLGTPEPIAPKICGQKGLVLPSMLHQKRMHAHRAVAGGACSILKIPFPGAWHTYTRQRQPG